MSIAIAGQDRSSKDHGVRRRTGHAKLARRDRDELVQYLDAEGAAAGDERFGPVGHRLQLEHLLRGGHFRVEVPVPPAARHAVVYSVAAMREQTFKLHVPASVQSVPIGNGGMIYLPVAGRMQPVTASPTGTLRVLVESRS